MSGSRPVVGVTGLPCAGKSFVANLLASGEVTGEPGRALEADGIGHRILEDREVVAALVDRFGPRVTDAEGRIVRAAMADIVFADPAELAWLERLTHPRIDAVVADFVRETAGRRMVIVEAALLFAAGLEKLCGLVLVVEADLAVRRRRAARRGWNAGELARREARLVPLFAEAGERDGGPRLAYIENNEENGHGELTERLRRAMAEATARKGNV
ncbi:MAG: dephospho-CoA kinase [Planctomycetota bacterium]|jgi:dephospho-CoA kinase|nr:dephospho-CoA kinase [Planctomycetota bacterium]